MGQDEARSVKRLATHGGCVLRKWNGQRAGVPVHTVPDDRMTEVGQVHAQLVGAPRLGMGRDK
jgi:hypothetical protein